MIERRFFHECPLHIKIVTGRMAPVKEKRAHPKIQAKFPGNSLFFSWGLFAAQLEKPMAGFLKN